MRPPGALLDALRGQGVRVNEIPGWQTRGRPAAFNPFGVMVHHTAGGRNGNSPSLNICIHGRADLPGPLYGILIGRDQTAHLIAAGRHNHAGMGSGIVLEESRRGAAPTGSASARRLSDTTGGNAHYYGISCEHVGTGAEPWTPGMIDTLVRCSAAVLWWIGQEGQSRRVVQHYEWTRRKVDMHWGLSLGGNVRNEVARRDVRKPEEGEFMNPEQWKNFELWTYLTHKKDDRRNELLVSMEREARQANVLAERQAVALERIAKALESN